MNNFYRVLTALCLLIFSYSISFSNTIRVPTDQATIQAGINTAGAGDTVLIASGIYTGAGNRNLSTAGKTVLVMGQYGADSTIIDCESAYDGFNTVSTGTQIRGLTIRNAIKGVNCVSVSPTIELNKIVNDSLGIYCENASSTIAGNIFQNNLTYPIWMTLGSNPILGNNTYINNGVQAVGLQAGVLQVDKTLYPDNVPYRVSSDLIFQSQSIYDTPHFTIKPGVTIAFDSSAGLRLGSGSIYPSIFEAVGTSESLITFTSWSGSSNGWDGINIRGGNISPSRIDHCVIENAGQNGWEKQANVFYDGSSLPPITNSIIRNSSQDGIYLNSSSPTITGTTFQNNVEYPIHMTLNSTLVNLGNTYIGNGTEALAVIGGDVGPDLTWRNDGNEPYLVLNNIRVTHGSSDDHPRLTILPGTKVTFADSARLQVGWGAIYSGELWAQGTADSVITFTSWNGQSGGWVGLRFEQSATSVLEHCIIEKAGKNDGTQQANIYCSGTSQPTMNECIVRSSVKDGLYLSSSSPTITVTMFQSNAGYPIHMGLSSRPQNTGNTYRNNGIEAIAIEGGDLGYTADATWRDDSGEPILVLSTIRITAWDQGYSPKLTIMPGTTVKFAGNAGLQVAAYVWPGQLRAQGTADSVITFTSWNGLSGGWVGLRFEQSATSVLEHCIIEKAGKNDGTQQANIYYDGTSQPTLDSCVIRGSIKHGIYLQDASPGIRNTQIVDNDSFGVYCAGNSNPIVGDSSHLTCKIYGNGAYDLYNNTTNTIYARNNFWGLYDSSAIAKRIYDNGDNQAKGSVLFMPFHIIEHDAMVERIMAPDSVVFYQTVLTPRALVRNTGENNDTIPVIFRIGSVYRDSNTIVLAPGDSGVVSFKNWIADSVGTFTIQCLTTLPSDSYNGNDTLHAIVATIIDPTAPIIFSITPNSVGNTGRVTAKIVGHNFYKGTSVRLNRQGASDIVVDSLYTYFVSSDTIVVIFDLRNATTGSWNVVVTNSTTKSATFHDGFTVEIGNDQIWVDVIGRNQIRLGRPETYWIQCGNIGNIDAFVSLLVSVPPGSEISIHDSAYGGRDSEGSHREREKSFVRDKELLLLSGFGDGSTLQGTQIGLTGYFPAGSLPKYIEIAVTANQVINPMWVRAGSQDLPLVAPPPFGSSRPMDNFVSWVYQPTVTVFEQNGHPIDNDPPALWDLLEDAFVGMFAPTMGSQITTTARVARGIVTYIVTHSSNLGVSFPDPGQILGEKPGEIDAAYENETRIEKETKRDATVTNSRDPNTKVGPVGYGDRYMTSQEQLYRYMIYFENVDSATAPAESIWISDTLSENLDWSTLEFDQTHSGDGPDSIRPNLNIVTNFDSLNGVVNWGLFNINLPPDTAPYWGEGWVSYSVRPKTNLPTGTQIKNRAFIKFDTNPWLYAPMDSSYVINTIDAAPPTSKISTLPDTVSSHYFQVCWSGHDDSLGSGIMDYSVYVSDDGGPYKVWLSNTSKTCSTYIGNTGQTYCFYSIARDNVGHAEIVTDTVCTTTRNYKVGDCNGDGKINVSDVVYLVNYLFKGGPPPVPGLAAGNVNCDTKVTVADIVYLVNYLFRGGPPPCVGTEYSVALNKSTQQGYVKSSFIKFDEKGDGVVSLSSGTKVSLAGMQLELEYNPTYIDKIEVYPTERTEGMGLYYSARDGKLTIGLVDIYGKNFIPSGEGPLLNLKVKPKTEKADLSSLKIQQAVLVDTLAKELEVTIIDDIKSALIPKAFSLSQNYPNPFNPKTVIEYALPMNCPVKISIYNILGQRVKVLVDENQTAGYKKVVWDSKNDEGQEVASGIYFYKIKAGDFTQSKKMVMIK